jgi:hypothetical protein
MRRRTLEHLHDFVEGPVWQQEYFDRALKHEEGIADKIEYILANPVAEGLVSNPLDYPWTWRETSESRPSAC